MRQDLLAIIDNLIFQDDEELSLRLAEQEMALRETPCRNTSIGKWVDEHELEYLYSALDLSDEDFGLRFPKLRHVTRPEREWLASTIKKHVDICPHCSLKHSYEIEWANRVKRVCQQHRQTLLKFMQEETVSESTEQEGEHRSNATLKESTVMS